jgi:hypothetical protein
MFSDKPVGEWAEVLDDADLPHIYYITFAALISTIFSMIFPWTVTYWAIRELAYLIIPKENADFVV